MSTRLSRRKLADYVAGELARGNKKAVTSLAAYLVAHRRTREARLIVRDIELRLMQTSGMTADVVSARELPSALKKAIAQYISRRYGGLDVQLEATVDPALIGGVVVRTPDAELDASIRTRITTLTT